jgi:glycosyltransferase involved in cell wall biosynthesis
MHPIAERLEINTFASKPEFLLKSLLLPAVMLRVSNLVNRLRPQIVVAPGRHHWNPFIFYNLVSQGARYVPIIHDARPHPGERYPYPMSFQRFELQHAAHVIALSDSVKAELVRFFGLAPEKVSVCELPLISGDTEPAMPKSIESGPFTFLFYGRILSYKGLDVLLAAFARLLGRGLDVHLIVAGQGDLPAEARAMVAQGKITLINRWIKESEIADIFKSAHAVVLPYREASQSGVIADAVANLRPMVVTRVGALPDQVKNGKLGLIAERPDEEDVASAMIEVMQPATYAALVENLQNETQGSDCWVQYCEILRDIARNQ